MPTFMCQYCLLPFIRNTFPESHRFMQDIHQRDTPERERERERESYREWIGLVYLRLEHNSCVWLHCDKLELMLT